MSKFEDKVAKILTERGIAFEREVSFKDLKYKGSLLRYDFCIHAAGKTILIECDGEQHFKQIKFFYKTKNEYYHMLENDRRKNKYAMVNKYLLFRIPYYDIDTLRCFADLVRPQYQVTNIYHNDVISRKLNGGR